MSTNKNAEDLVQRVREAVLATGCPVVSRKDEKRGRGFSYNTCLIGRLPFDDRQAQDSILRTLCKNIMFIPPVELSMKCLVTEQFVAVIVTLCLKNDIC